MWVKCFCGLKKRSYEAKLEFARKIEDPTLKALLVSLAYEHLKLAETLRTLFNVEYEDIDPFSRECREALGTGILDSIAKAKAKIREIFSKEKTTASDVEELLKMLRVLNDISKGCLLSIAKIANPSIAKVVVFLAETQDAYYRSMEEYLRRELKGGGVK